MAIDPLDLTPEQISKTEQEPIPNLNQVSTAISDIGEHAIYFSTLLAAGSAISTREDALSEAAKNVTPAELEFAEKSAIEFLSKLQLIRRAGKFPSPQPQDQSPLFAIDQ